MGVSEGELGEEEEEGGVVGVVLTRVLWVDKLDNCCSSNSSKVELRLVEVVSQGQLLARVVVGCSKLVGAATSLASTSIGVLVSIRTASSRTSATR